MSNTANNDLTTLDSLIKSVVSRLYNYAKDHYANLSSFAIVTDEGYECFGIAINTNGYFSDLMALKIADEDYWNTAEWIEEDLRPVPIDKDMNAIYDLLNDMDLADRAKHFLPICLEGLISIRNDDAQNNNNICLFVHVTDHEFDNDLYSIVRELNPKPVAQSYKNYYDGWE